MNIEDRLAKLERENRRWRLAAISLAGILGLSIACSSQWDAPGAGLPNQAFAQPSDAPPIYDTIRVRNLEVFDHNSRKVGDWSGAGGGILRIENADRTNTIHLTASDSEASIFIATRDYCSLLGDHQLFIGRIGTQQRRALDQLSRRHELSEAQISEAQKRSHPTPVAHIGTELGMALEGAGHVAVYNALGKRVGLMEANRTNEGTLLLMDATERPRTMVTCAGVLRP
jgi:hypothetical protein